MRFDSTPAHTSGDEIDWVTWGVRLEGPSIFASSSAELKALSAVDGKKLWSVGAQGEPKNRERLGSQINSAPAFIQKGGVSAVLTAFDIVVPGAGTTAEREAIELTAVASDTGKRLWSATVERPEVEGGQEPVLVGSDGKTAVVQVAGSFDQAVLGISLESGRTLWTAKEFLAGFVHGGVVVGRASKGSDNSIVALNTADGSQAWSNYKDARIGASVTPLGKGLFTAPVDPDRTVLLDAATGKPPAGSDGTLPGDPADAQCTYDDRDTIVCTEHFGVGSERNRVSALDATSFKELWAIDSEDTTRLVPAVTTAWHGAVYAKTSNGPVILDARTGQDKELSPGAAPSQINGYIGLGRPGPGQGSDVVAFRPVS
ncbi:PQQ-binding-like beta-propeller repeat protein [Streptomyces hydrogenans]|uniref:outer membrane protein assembly factor BamB family protein n=1 Tax=Streptomyces hydrogenans TaxID=1873719 RepID=UPI0036A37FD5